MNIVPDYAMEVTPRTLEYLAEKGSTYPLLLEEDKYPDVEPGTIIRFYCKQNGNTILRRVNHVMRKRPGIENGYILAENELLN